MSLLRRLSWPGRMGLAIAIAGVLTAVSYVPHLRAQSEASLTWKGMTALEGAMYEEAARQGLDYLPNQVLVRFKDGVSRQGQQRALMALRSRPGIDEVKWAGPLAVVNDLGQSNPLILAQQLREQPEVLYAEPNYLQHPTSTTPTDPDYSSKQWNFPVLDLPRAWDINPGAEGITVAVVDSGVTNYNGNLVAPTWNGSSIVNFLVRFTINPDLPESRLVTPRDFVNGGTLVLDMDGHGTHVSGTVGEETSNGVMLAGIAYKAKIMPVKVCQSYWDVQFTRSANGTPGYAPLSSGGCPNSATVPGIMYAADNGAKVINYSISGPSPSTALLDAFTYALGKGVFVAVAAGNEYDNGNPTRYPAKYAETTDGMMAVGALNRSLKHAYYSTSGSFVEIAAPGGDFDDGGDPGGIWQSTIRESDSDPEFVIFPRFDRFDERSLQGTSMASPHVAGIAALLMGQLGSSATPALVEQILKKTARACAATSCDASATGSRARNDFFGVGLVQPRTALFGMGPGHK